MVLKWISNCVFKFGLRICQKKQKKNFFILFSMEFSFPFTGDTLALCLHSVAQWRNNICLAQLLHGGEAWREKTSPAPSKSKWNENVLLFTFQIIQCCVSNENVFFFFHVNNWLIAYVHVLHFHFQKKFHSFGNLRSICWKMFLLIFGIFYHVRMCAWVNYAFKMW